jgi:UrcA family protein
MIDMKLFTSALIAASLATLPLVPAAAEPVLLTIEASDLDLSTPAGAERLNQRIAARLERACERPFMRDLKAMKSFEECVSTARDVTDRALALATPATAG